MQRLLALLISLGLSLIPAVAAAQDAADLPPRRFALRDQTRVAVMPFKALTAGQKAWIGAGLSETLTAALSTVPTLRVVERSQLRAIQAELRLAEKDLDSEQSAVQVGKLLGANRLVIGSFQIAGGEILINGRFVTTGSGVVGKTFQLRGKVEQIFDLYPKLTKEVLGLLGAKVQGKSQEALGAAQTPPSSEAAEALYVQGREAFHQRSAAGYRRAVELLTKATQEDPGYALGFAALAEAQAELAALDCAPLQLLTLSKEREPFCHIPFKEPELDAFAKVLGHQDRDAAFEDSDRRIGELRKACRRALQVSLGNATTAASLAPALPAAHRALGLAYWHGGQRQKAEIEARTLLNLNRSDAWGYYLLGLCSTEKEESRAHHGRSLELDPMLLQNHLELAAWSYSNDPDPAPEQGEKEARERLEQALKLPGSIPELHALLGELYLRQGKPREALAQADRALKGQPVHPRAHLVRAVALWQIGGPPRPWDRRLAWQDEAALAMFKARLWEVKSCNDHSLAHPVEVFDATMPLRLRRGEPWKQIKKTLEAVQGHLSDARRDAEEDRGRCAGRRPGTVLFLDMKTQYKPVDRWDRTMLLKHENPQLLTQWWDDRSWNEVVFELVVCAGQPVTPDDEVRAELLFDGQAQPVWPALTAEGRAGRERDSRAPGERLGAPGRFTRPKSEFRLWGRWHLKPLREALQDGSEHRLSARVRRGGKVIAEGQIPFRMVDTSEAKD